MAESCYTILYKKDMRKRDGFCIIAEGDVFMTPIPSKDTFIKKAFSQALEELLREKKLDDITTSEIIKVSGLSRSTFYRHFTDKYELANWKYRDLLGRLSKDHASPDTSAENIRTLIWFIGENRSFYRKVMSYTGQNSFYEYYLNTTLEWAKTIQGRAHRTLRQKDVYTLRYHAAGVLDILAEWLQSDDPISADDFCDIILENRSELLRELYTDPPSSY